MDTASADFDLGSFGTIAILTPQTGAAVAWTDAHLAHATRFAGAIALEARYAPTIAERIIADGLTLTR